MIGHGGLTIAVLLTKLDHQGLTNLFLQGNIQRMFEKYKVYEFYTNGIEYGYMFSSSVRGAAINLVVDDVGSNQDIP